MFKNEDIRGTGGLLLGRTTHEMSAPASSIRPSS